MVYFGHGNGRKVKDIAVATTVRTGTFLWARGARPQKCPKSNGSSSKSPPASIHAKRDISR
jgi:hypothetical protein